MFKKHMKRALAFLLAALLMFSAVPSVFAADGSADTQKFMSFNLRHDLTSHPLMGTDVRGEHLMEIVEKYAPDSIGFQEATNDWMNYLRDAMGELGYAYAGVGRDDGQDGAQYTGDANEHTPVFYNAEKYDLLESGTFWLSETPDVVSGRDWGEACRRICTYVVLQDKETGEIYGHFNTHLDHVALDTQANGVRIILNRIDTVSEKYPDMACVVTGDFNSARADAEDPDYDPVVYNYMTSRLDDSRELAESIITDGSSWSGYQDPEAWENGQSSSSDRPAVDTDNYPIDYIFLSKGDFDVKTYTIVDDMFTFEYDGQTWHNHPVSDHYGVYCETERVDDPEEESADESNIIDLPGKTVTGSSDPSKEELLDLIGLSERDSLMSGASASSNMECAEGHSVSSVLGTEGTAQVVSSSGNVYWEITVDLGALSEIGAITYTAGDDQEAVPQNVEFLISANNSTWEKAGGTMFREAEAGSVSYILLDEAVYGRYVRMVIPDTPSGTEVANLSVYSGTEGQKKLEAVAADQYTEISGPAAVNDSGETYENLFDDNLSTKWYYSGDEVPSAIVFRTEEAVTALKYSLTTGNDHSAYSGRVPGQWTLFGSETGADGSWIVIDQQTDSDIPDGMDYMEYVVDIAEPAAYQYYMLQFDGLGTEDCIQFSEFDLYTADDGTETDGEEQTKKVDPSDMTAVSGPEPVNDSGEEYENLFDGDIDTKWYYKDETDQAAPDAIIFMTAEGVTVSSYSFTTANDSARFPGRSPSLWTLSGADSADGPWTVIDDREYTVADVNSQEFVFEIANPAEYQYYKLEFEALGTDSRLQLAEVSLYQTVSVSHADYSAVKAAAEEIPEDLDIYTAESLKRLADAVLAVDYTKAEAEQDLVNAMAEEIREAAAALEKETESFVLPYLDVDPVEDAWFYDAASLLYQEQIMTGYSDDAFGPADPLKRCELATILYRMAGSPEVEYAGVFPDVPEGTWYTDAVIWANQSGIITGYSSGLFGPDDYCTREQMATMMWRMAKTAGIDMSVTADLDSFPDGEQVSDFAREALSWCVGNDIISGMGTDGSLDPQGMTRRAHCAVIIVRYMELGIE